jgi:hypothetical protein
MVRPFSLQFNKSATPISAQSMAPPAYPISQFEVMGPHGMQAQSDTLMNLCRILGEAFRLMCRFHCKEATEHIESKLTQKQRNTGWV